MKTITIGSASIPLDSYAIGGTALLGIRGSGKTWCAKGIAEQLLEHRVPIVVFDPIGVWRHLKVPASKNGKGYAVVVAGGLGADLHLTPQTAKEIVRAAMRENISLVVDLYDHTLSKADWRRIVQSCFRVLLYENQGMRHVFLEEAAEYVPQKVNDGETYAEVEKLVRMGGNKSLGITLINQRSQEVNKAVLDLCENLVLMRQMGAHAINALEKWVDKVSPDFAGEIARGMPRMQPGEAWVFAGAAEKPIFTRSGPIRTYHPDRKKPDAKIAAAATDTSAFVEAMQRALPAIVEQQQSNDPALLKKRIRELEAAAKRPPAPATSTSTKVPGPDQHPSKQELRKAAATVKRLQGAIEALMEFVIKINVSNLTTKAGDAIDREELQKAIEAAAARAEKMIEARLETRNKDLDRLRLEAQRLAERVKKILADTEVAVSIDITHNEPFTISPPAPSRNIQQNPTSRPQIANSGHAAKGERRVLIAIAQHPEGVDRQQVTILTGYKRSTRDAYLQRLATRGLIDLGPPIVATDAGHAELPADFAPLPTGDALREHWLRTLPAGECAVLEAVVEAYPEAVQRDLITENTSYKRSTRDAYIQRLATRKLVTTTSAGVRAADMLFG